MVSTGDQVLLAAEPVELPNNRLVSRALDNRLGVYVALEVARRVKEAGGGGGPVAGVAAVQEEIGAHGARVMAYGVEPDLAGSLDEERGVRAGQHGHGPTLGVRDEDLDRLQLLLLGEPQGFLETARGRQVPAYPVGARLRSGRGFGHAADSIGYARVPL